MGAIRIFSRFDELLDVEVTRVAPAWFRLNADGTVTERTAAQTLADLGGVVVTVTNDVASFTIGATTYYHHVSRTNPNP